uniref:Protein FAM133-like n=1 Tax=Angiostrongylus cantonensis TaxID=6313 RepID=A0A0K0CSW8_ANGCA
MSTLEGNFAGKTVNESSTSSSSSDSENSSLETSSESDDPEKEKEMERERERRKQEARRRERKREKRRRRKLKGVNRRSKSKKESSESDSESCSEKDEKEVLNEALRKVEKDRIECRQKYLEGDRKRKYNTTYEVKPLTEAEQEAYKLTAIHSADPMASYMHEKLEKKARKAGL